MWPQLMCCALASKNLVSINFRLGKEESCGAEVEWCGSKHGAIGSKCGAGWIKMRSKVDQNVEQGGANCGAKWSKGYVFLFDSNWSLALRQAHLNTGITEIS